MDLNSVKISPVFSFFVEGFKNKCFLVHVDYSQDKVYYSHDDVKELSMTDLQELEAFVLKKIDKKTIKNPVNFKLPDIELNYEKAFNKMRDTNG